MMTIRTQRSIDAPWFEIYPIEELIATSHSSQVFLVDVGGGVGHQIIDLKKHYPKVGRMIVEDIEAVTKTIQDLPDGIEALTADFFHPQPIKGAKVYYIAHCLHDWPDKEASTILGHIKDAMAPDSVLLLSESVMPERDVPFMTAATDLMMMAAFASLERSEKQFEALLEGVGLELVKVWHKRKEGTAMLESSILEAKLKSAA